MQLERPSSDQCGATQTPEVPESSRKFQKFQKFQKICGVPESSRSSRSSRKFQKVPEVPEVPEVPGGPRSWQTALGKRRATCPGLKGCQAPPIRIISWFLSILKVLGGGPAVAEGGEGEGEGRRRGKRKAARRGTKEKSAGNSARKWRFARERENG